MIRILLNIIVLASLALIAGVSGWAAYSYLQFPVEYSVAAGAGIMALLMFGYLFHLRSEDKSDTKRGFQIITSTLGKAQSRIDELEINVQYLEEQSSDLQSRNEALESELSVMQTLMRQIASLPDDAGVAQDRTPDLPEYPKRRKKTDRADTGEEDVVMPDPAPVPAEKPKKRPPQPGLKRILRDAVEDSRVDLYAQPIVALPSRRVSHYECFSRVRDEKGEVFRPADYLPVAEEAGISGTLDNLLMFRCIQLLRKLGPRRPDVRFFLNISAASLADEDFMPQFVDFLANNKRLTDRLVFEIRQADLDKLSRQSVIALGRLADAGFLFSLDDVRFITLNLSSLLKGGIRFAKIDTSRLLEGRFDIHPDDLVKALRRQNIDLITTKVEEEDQVLPILDMDIQYGQGFLFGEPRPAGQKSEKGEGQPRRLKTAASGA